MIGRKAANKIIEEQVNCEICGKTSKGLKLERHEGIALLTCEDCRNFGIEPPKPKRKTRRDTSKRKAS